MTTMNKQQAQPDQHANQGTQPRSRRHVPQRTCVVCRTRDAKRQLTRIVRTESGVLVDSTGKHNGRGAYLCDDPGCWERAIRTDVLAKALRMTLSGEDRLRLEQAAPVP